MRKGVGLVAAALLILAPASPAFAADNSPPTQPGDLRVVASTATTVTLAWNPSTDDSGSLTYQLQDNWGAILYPRQSQTTASLTGLLPGRAYTYTIWAFDAARNYSTPSTVTHVTPPDTTAPSAPTLTVAYLAPARMSVSWTRSTDDTSLVIHYTLLVDGSPRPGDIRTGLGQTLLDLTPETTYSLVVSARDPYGNTSLSQPVTVTTPPVTDVTPPSAPANLRGRADASGCEVYLSWDQSADDVDTQARLLYRFRVNGSLAPSSSFVVGRGTNVGVTVLEGHHSGVNTFTVEAVDGSGNTSPSSNEFALNVPNCD